MRRIGIIAAWALFAFGTVDNLIHAGAFISGVPSPFDRTSLVPLLSLALLGLYANGKGGRS